MCAQRSMFGVLLFEVGSLIKPQFIRYVGLANKLQELLSLPCQVGLHKVLRVWTQDSCLLSTLLTRSIL